MNYLQNKHYLALLVGNLLAKLSLGFYEVAIIWWITELTGSGSTVALIAFVGSVVYLLTAPFGGILADKRSKKHLSILGLLTDGIFTAIAAILLFTGNLDIITIIVLLGLTNIATALREPAISALLPLILTKESYQKGNATMGLVSTTASLGSYGLAGILVAVFGVGWTLLIGSGFLLTAVFPFLFLKEPEFRQNTQNKEAVNVELDSTEVREQAGWISHLKENFSFILQKPLILALTFTATLINFLLAPLTVVLAPFSQAIGAGSEGYGLLAAGIVAGQLVGLIILNIWEIKRPFYTLVGGTLTIAISLIGLSLLSSIPTAFIAVMCIGLATSVMSVQIQVVLQKSVSAEMMGRAYGLLSSLVTIAQPAGFALAGILLTTQTPQTLFAFMGILTTASTMAWYRGHVRKSLSSIE